MLSRSAERRRGSIRSRIPSRLTAPWKQRSRDVKHHEEIERVLPDEVNCDRDLRKPVVLRHDGRNRQDPEQSDFTALCRGVQIAGNGHHDQYQVEGKVGATGKTSFESR